MADDATPPEADDAAEGAGPTERVRGFVARARRAPTTVDALAREVDALRAGLGDIDRSLASIEQLVWAGRDDTRGGVAAVGDELHALADQLTRTDERVTLLDAALAAQATALHRAVAAPARQAAARALRDTLGPPPPLRPGLSVFTLAWNHGDLLEESVRSALAALDRLPSEDQGEVLIIDDGSTDRTPDVCAHLAAADPRVRVVRSPVNIGLALARTTLLHTATTSHAFQLDADNTALPDGVVALWEVARGSGAALTYGNVIQVDGAGEALGPISNEPPSAALFGSNYVDTMAVVDVAAIRTLGGWSADPLLEHVDDWAAVQRVAEAGLLIAFVPTVVGRYRVLETAFHRTVADPRLGAARVARVFDPTGRRRGPDPLAGIAAVALDPVVGPLWATPAAVARHPELAPRVTEPVLPPASTDRILVVAPGGVANLGDDAITLRGVERLRTVLGPDVALDLVTDGPALIPAIEGVRWLGPLIDALPGLGYDDLGRLDEHLADAAETALIGQGRWRPLEPAAYRAAVFLGGGSLASDFSGGLIAPRALLAAALRAARVPHLLSGQGIGPLTGVADRTLVARLLAGSEMVACRDQTSAEVARSLPGVDPTHVVVTGDDALGLAPAPPATTGSAPPVLVVTVRRAPYVADAAADPVRAWAERVDAVATARGWDVLGVALNRRDPEPELATLATVRATADLRARWHLVDCGDDPRRLVELCHRGVAVAAQSFHAALFGLAAGRPTVLAAGSDYYVAKASGLVERTGLPTALAVGPHDDLATALDAVTEALRVTPEPTARAAAAVDAWWATVPERLGARGRLSG